MAGTLYLIATPIGNLSDITVRALDTLKIVDVIVSEDCDVSLRLLQRYAINKPMKQLNSGNEAAMVQSIISILQQGQSIGYISEAGSPTVADPGYLLVRHALDNAIDVIPIPGVSACIAALMVGGLPSEQFTFRGFLPKKQAEMKSFFNSLTTPYTTVVYVSVHKIDDFLRIGNEVMPNRRVTIARELTKLHEEFIRGTFQELATNPFVRKGEFTVLIEGEATNTIRIDDDIVKKRLKEIVGSHSAKDTARIIAEEFGLRKNDVYKKLIENEKH